MAFSARGLLALLAACLATVAAGYSGVVAAPFVADDYNLLAGLDDGSTGLAAIGMRRGAEFLRPVLGLGFLVEQRVLGANPVAMHLHNLALHALGAWLLGIVGAMWTGARAAGVVAALVFACFPVHPEAVTWISARGYPLAGCGTLAAIALALRVPLSRRALALCGACAAASLLAVEPAVPLLAYPLLLVWARGEPRRAIWPGVVLLAVTLAYLALRMAWLGGLGGYHGPDGASRHGTWTVGATLAYLAQGWGFLLAPGPWDGADGAAASVLVGVVAALGLSLHATVPLGAAHVRGGLALAGCIMAALSVTATWASLGHDLSGTRYLYFASMFWCLGLGWSAALLLRAGGWRRVLAKVAIAGVLAAQLALVRAVNARWREGGDQAHAAVQGVVDRVRTHGTRHVFLFGQPRSFRGAHALPWGMEAALLRLVGKQLRVDVLHDAGAFAVVQRTHAVATEAERRNIDVGAWDPAAKAWRWQE